MNLYALVAWVDNYGDKYPKLIISDTDKGNVLEQFEFIKKLCKLQLDCDELKLIRAKLIKLSLYALSFNGVELITSSYIINREDMEKLEDNMEQLDNAIQGKLENDMENIDKEELKELLKSN